MFRHLLIMIAVIIAAVPSVGAEEPVFVWLQDGRMLAGHVDARTDEERLWLRSSSATFVLTTSVAWTNIDAASVDGQKLSAEQLQHRADDLKSPVPADHLQLGVRALNEPVMNLPRPLLNRADATRVASLAVEARVANWDRDAEVDGVEIRVLPRNIFGEVVPASGQLLVELTGRNRLPIRDQQAFPRLGRWSMRVEANDFAAHGAVFQLPFRNTRPDAEPVLELHALVEATFIVFGQGRFDAEAPVYVRPFNPLRDDLRRRKR